MDGGEFLRAVPPETYRPMADVDAALDQQIFDLSQRQRVANIHHHREADDLWRTVEIAEGISHLAKLWMPHLHINPFCLTTPLRYLRPQFLSSYRRSATRGRPASPKKGASLYCPRTGIGHNDRDSLVHTRFPIYRHGHPIRHRPSWYPTRRCISSGDRSTSASYECIETVRNDSFSHI